MDYLLTPGLLSLEDAGPSQKTGFSSGTASSLPTQSFKGVSLAEQLRRRFPRADNEHKAAPAPSRLPAGQLQQSSQRHGQPGTDIAGITKTITPAEGSARITAAYVPSFTFRDAPADWRWMGKVSEPAAQEEPLPVSSAPQPDDSWQEAAIRKQSFTRPHQQQKQQQQQQQQDYDSDDLWEDEPAQTKQPEARAKPQKRQLSAKHACPSPSGRHDDTLMESPPKRQKAAPKARNGAKPRAEGKAQQQRGRKKQPEPEPDGDEAPEQRGGSQEVDETDVVAQEFAVQNERGPESLHGTLGDGCTDPLVLSAEDPSGRQLKLSVPASINGHLRVYQRAGVQFLFRQYARGKGGVLADDMGLGKTVQTIAFFAALLGKTGNIAEDSAPTVAKVSGQRRTPLLLLAPASVLDNWMRELAQWGAFKAVKLHSGVTLQSVQKEIEKNSTEIVVTSHDTYRIREGLAAIDWHAVVVDEAHKLKNTETAIFKAAQKLKTTLRYGLTGTAMQNDFKELWALLSFVAPDDFCDPNEFKHFYSDPMKLGQAKDASDHHLGRGRLRATQLRGLLEKFMLRRTKAIISDLLPKKQDHIVFCQLPQLQLRAYKRTLESPDFKAMMLKDPLICQWQGVLWSHYHNCQCGDEFGCKWHMGDGCDRCPWCLIMPCLILLRKISNHLEMVKADERDPPLKRERAEDVAGMVLGRDANELGGLQEQPSWIAAANTNACGKLAVLERLLDIWREDATNKVLIFSHSVRMLKIIREVVVRRGFAHAWLDGSTPVKNRQAICDDFNTRAATFLFLISTTAGGQGLNLTAANKVVIIDPSWNPAHDLQAQDRAFRIGQKRDVSVYRLIATGTMEELIYTRQVYKQQQTAVATEGLHERRYFEGVQGIKGKEGELWGIHNLLKLTADRVETQKIIAEQRQTEANYRIQEVDMGQIAAAAPTARAGQQHEDGDAEDAGLAHLVGHMTEKAMGGESQSGSDEEAQAETRPAEHNRIMEGALGIVAHGSLLGGSRVESARAHAAMHKLSEAHRDNLPVPEGDRQLPDGASGGHMHNAEATWDQDQVRIAQHAQALAAAAAAAQPSFCEEDSDNDAAPVYGNHYNAAAYDNDHNNALAASMLDDEAAASIAETDSDESADDISVDADPEEEEPLSQDLTSTEQGLALADQEDEELPSADQHELSDVVRFNTDKLATVEYEMPPAGEQSTTPTSAPVPDQQHRNVLQATLLPPQPVAEAQIDAAAVVRSLADWLQLSELAAAEKLLSMTTAQRLSLRQEYAAAYEAAVGA